MLLGGLRRDQFGNVPVTVLLQPHAQLRAFQLALDNGLRLLPRIREEVNVFHEPVPVLFADAGVRQKTLLIGLQPNDEIIDRFHDA